MRKITSISLALVLVAVMLAGLVPAAFAAETALQNDLRRESQEPSFHREFGIYYDAASGFVYVSDSLRNRIIKTKMDGSGWATLGTLGDKQGQFKDPRGIYYDAASGFLYVTDCGNHRIVKTKMDGSGWATLGSEGRADKQFLTPRGVQYDAASGLLYVADTGNDRVISCAWDGSGWTALGKHGRGTGEFREPRGIHYDAATGNIYVADHGNNRIVQTKMEGTGWSTYGSFGNGVGNFYFPRGISLDPATGTAYVADTFNGRIVATKMDGEGWQSLGVRYRPYAWYFAEGTTRGEFSMFLTICNPGTADAKVDISYMLSNGTVIPQSVNVIAHSRYTIDVKKVVGPDKDLSVKLTSMQPVIVEPVSYTHLRA